jgi:UDP-glucose 4-epimerase
VRILVVGGAGFLGSHLVERLLSEEHMVDVVDDLSTGSLANLAEARASGGRLKFHHLDAGSPDADSLIGMRMPEVIHLLVPLPSSEAGPGAFARTFEIVLSTLESARRHGVGRIVVAVPATTVYGHPTARSLPVKEGEPGQLVPRGVRGVLACAIVDLLVTYRDLHAVEFTALAMASVYGDRATTGVTARLSAAIAAGTPPTIDGDGRQTRDLLFVDDAVDALAKASTRGGGLVINVGTGVQTSVGELWTRLVASTPNAAALQPVHGPARRDELARFAVSPVRARIHLAWSPWTSLDDGLARLGAAWGHELGRE